MFGAEGFEVDLNELDAAFIITLTMALAMGYAIVRYHVVGPVPWKDLSFFILNKGICMGAFILLVLNFSLGPLKNLGAKVPESWLEARKQKRNADQRRRRNDEHDSPERGTLSRDIRHGRAAWMYEPLCPLLDVDEDRQ